MFKVANVGTVDRILRIVLGAFLIAAPYFVASEIWQNDLYRLGLPIVGAVLVLTALIRFCPLYRIFSIRTCH